MENLIFFALAFYVLNALYYFLGLHRLLKRNTKPLSPDSKQPLISVIVPARNEEENIASCLSALEKQNLPIGAWELWIIDDQSNDKTFEIAQSIVDKNKNFNLIRIKPGGEEDGFKKQAVQKGIDSARGEYIVTTDADCIMGEDWLKDLTSAFNRETGLVVGMPVYRFKNRIIELFQALDYASLSLISISLVGNHTPIMCSAANMAYRKEAFEDVNGFAAVEHFISGDDDLLLQKIVKQRKWKIAATVQPSTFTYTKPVKTWGALLDQRSRWGSKGAFYPLKWTRFYLSFIFITQLIFLIGWIFIKPSAMIFSWLVKLFFDLLMTLTIIRTTGELRLIFGYLFVSIGQPFFMVVAAARGFLGKFKWK